MIIGTLILLSSSLLNTKPAPVFAEIHIGADGPYRFLVDTGAQTSLIDSKLAATLRLQPQFRIHIITQNGAQLSPGIKVRNLSIGGRELPETELIIYDIAEARRLDPTVRGVLGVNALSAFDFTLSPLTGNLDLTAERPDGEVVPFYAVEGRIGLKAQMGSETLTLILDSGSTHVVLFRTPQAMAKTKSLNSTFGTIDGARQTVPTTWTEDMFFDRLRVPMVPAAIVQRKATQADGLLPASVFQKIHVDRTRGEVVLVPRPEIERTAEGGRMYR
jgi:predicted aspartyl protease